ncbi:MAG: carboxylesterase family protein [Bryobacteraceae bacterium]
MSCLLVVTWLLPVTHAQPRKTDSSPMASVRGGQLRGTLNGTTAVFQGVPYAAPPIGSLRWREPLPPQPWSGIRDATKPGNACVQNVAGLDAFIAPLAATYGASYNFEPVSSSEDCLYLNVWSPNWPNKGVLPVMVWLHGGSNRIGSGAQSTYAGESLASHGVVIVTINYRLGVLGFFSHPELTKESPHHSSGNYGLLDQLAALRWVRENIAGFGGDPRNVTLFGESAGSIDAGTLAASPLATGLFRRVILESGPPFGLGAAHTLQQAEAVGTAIGKAAPGHATSTLENLRSLPATQVVELASQTIKTQFKGYDPLAQLVDGWVLPQATSKAFGSGTIQKVDLLVGLNGRELSAFRVGAAMAARQNPTPEKGGSSGDAVKKLADTARPLYGGWTNAAIGMYMAEMLIHRDAAIDGASNDMLMACPIGAVAALASNAGQRVYVYKFDRSIPGKGEADLGAFHGLEVPYVFNSFDDRSWRWLPFSEVDHKLSHLIEVYWTNFAKRGDPNAAGLPSWSPWQSSGEPYLEFNQDGSATARGDFAPPFCHLSADRLRQQLAGN